jgi:uncharacterized FlgJ-related protein
MNYSTCCDARIEKDYFKNKRCSYCKGINKGKFNWRKFLPFLFLLIFLSYSIKEYSKIIILPKIMNYNSDVKLNKDSIFQQLLKDSVLFPEYAIHSCMWETGHLSSPLCRDYNNLFGITYVNSEYQSGYVVMNGMKFAKYSSKKNCIKDYKRLQKYYAINIDKRYSDNKNYTENLKKLR